MHFSRRDQHLGALLRQMIRYAGSSTITEVNDKAGLFKVNGQTHLLAKYTEKDASPWRFTFTPEDIETLRANFDCSGFFGGSYVGLKCGSNAVCLLHPDEWAWLLDSDRPDEQKTLRVSRSARCQFRVTGPSGELEKCIPISRFPAMIFEATMNSRS